MAYYSEKRNIKETTQNKTVAIATHEVGADVIVKALNYYFEKETFTKNQCVEMMNNNTSFAFTNVADFLEKHEYTGEMAIDYLRELAEQLSAQAVVVSMRDELKFGSPNQ